jgi:hypothetical protein
MILPPVAVGLALAALYVTGELIRVWFGTDEPPAAVLVGAVLVGLLSGALFFSRPTEVRIEDDGIRVRSWGEVAHEEEGKFIPTSEEPGFVLGPSGSFLASVEERPIRISVNTWELQAAAAEKDIAFDRLRTWWAWKILLWSGALTWVLIPALGGLLLLGALGVRIASKW